MMKKKKGLIIGLGIIGLLLGAWIWMVGFHEGKYSSKETPFNVPGRIVKAIREGMAIDRIKPTLVTRSNQLTLGILAPDFSAPGLGKDQLIRLSDYRGQKVVLLEFWASWCGGCRRQNGHWWDLYTKHRDKDFEIIGISMDRSKRAWKKAIEQDQLVWPQICDGKGAQSALINEYGVYNLPLNFLVDKEGKIVGKNLEPKEVEEWLLKNH